MIFSKLTLGIFASNNYILADEESKEAAIVDIGGDLSALKKELDNLCVKPVMILLTHGHLDHVVEAPQAREMFKAPVYMHEADKEIFKDSKIRAMFGDKAPNEMPVDHYIKDGDIISLGNHKIRVIHTPGHTQGSVCFLIDDKFLLSGDTLFRGTIGRTDHIGGDTEQEVESIKEKLMVLPDDIEVFPGHGGQTTIGYERLNNGFLQ